MDLVRGPFDRVSILDHQDEGISHTKIKGLCQEMTKENFNPGKD